MINEIRYETFQSDVDYTLPSVFLAGPTVRGNQPHLKSWRPDAVAEFARQGFSGNLIIPEFSDREASDKSRYDIPIWEFEGLCRSHVIMFWIPRTKELIGLTTNHELGYWMARDRFKVVYGRPDNAYRVSYCDIMWIEDLKDQHSINGGPEAAIHTTLEKTVAAVMKNKRLLTFIEEKNRYHGKQQ